MAAETHKTVGLYFHWDLQKNIHGPFSNKKLAMKVIQIIVTMEIIIKVVIATSNDNDCTNNNNCNIKIMEKNICRLFSSLVQFPFTPSERTFYDLSKLRILKKISEILGIDEQKPGGRPTDQFSQLCYKIAKNWL